MRKILLELIIKWWKIPNRQIPLKVEEEGLAGVLAYENMKPASGMEDSLTGLYICDLVYPHTSENGITSDRNYELQLYYWRPETAEEYEHIENEVDNILLMEKESQDAVLLYEVDERFTPTKDLQGFLQRDYGLEQYLICDLPGDFTLGEYMEDYLSQHPGTEEVLKSHYWYVFMGKEDSEIFYVLFLNQEHFTKDDVIRMAHSVQFTERAF